MNGRLIAIVPLGLLLAVALIEAADTAALFNIDMTRYSNHIYDHYQIKIKDVVEEHGSEDPKRTAALIAEMEKNLRDMLNDEMPLFGDKYRLLEGIQNREGVENLLYSVRRFKALTEQKPDSCDQGVLHNYLKTVGLFFGSDLEAFLNDKPTHDTKLHAFLLHYGKKFAGYCLGITFESEPATSQAETQLEGMIDNGKVADDQRKSLERACFGFKLAHGDVLTFYNLARLMAPEESAKFTPTARVQKLNEYLGICMSN